MPQRHAVTKLASLPPGTGRAFVVAGTRVGLFNVDGRIHAIDDICPHAGASLSDGPLQGKVVSCPWHYADFDVTSGKSLCPPAYSDVKSFPVFVNGDSIEVEL